MTRSCMCCRRNLGEKCSVCGGETRRVFYAIDSETRERVRMFTCMNDRCAYRLKNSGRRFQFAEGEGGDTTGICRSCHAAENRKMREERPVSR